ncbi:MAG TPA: diadenylate cyclase CdaA [Paludibacter sp.]|nr:diadenylate cyclase CdaA [Paludibacter sp.]
MGFKIGFKDIVDVFLVAVLLYQMFKLLKRTGAVNIFIGILAFVICWFLVSFVFKMELLGGIFDRVVSVGAFALIVIFQDEIRRFFSRIGSRRNWNTFSTLKRFFGGGNADKEKTDFDMVQVVLACRNMSKSSTGGLIVITRTNNLDFYSQSGEPINSLINSRLIESIFFKNSPLHDGSIIISHRTIKAAACILPVSKNQAIPKRMGLRHRAALGITEHSDAIAIVISEETGHISWAVNGQLTVNVKPEQLEHFLSQELGR